MESALKKILVGFLFAFAAGSALAGGPQRFVVFGDSLCVAAPGAFGLTDVTQPCIALNTKARAYCANPATFLFWDGIHPTKAGHRLLAERAAAALSERVAAH